MIIVQLLKKFNSCSWAAENQDLVVTGKLHASLVGYASSIQGK